MATFPGPAILLIGYCLLNPGTGKKIRNSDGTAGIVLVNEGEASIDINGPDGNIIGQVASRVIRQ